MTIQSLEMSILVNTIVRAVKKWHVMKSIIEESEMDHKRIHVCDNWNEKDWC